MLQHVARMRRLSSRCLYSTTAYSSRANTFAFIGLGQMGSHMAINLFSKTLAADPHTEFIVCDAMPAAAETFAQKFAASTGGKVRVVKTPEEAAQAAQTVITMLPSSPHVLSVYSEAGGIIPALRSLPPDIAKQTLCIDSTTLDVEVARGVAKEVTQVIGAQMVDAPVSGGVAGAKAGTLSFLVGGAASSYTASNPLLSRMGKRIIHCGDSGAGLAAKICNNLVLGVQQIVVSEAMLLGVEGLGLKSSVLASVINSSTGACWSCSVNNPVPGALKENGKEPPCERGYEGGFATALMLKDMGLATNIAKAHGTAMPLGKAAEKIYQAVVEKRPDLARKDFSSVHEFLRPLGSV